MSRLYLIFFLTISSCAFGQSLLSKYLKHADENYQKGDFYYAIELYEKAMKEDSNAVEVLWKYAETLRAYKDYRRAEYYYAKVYEKELGAFFPASLLNLGLMQKQNGKYDVALETFKKAKKKYYKDKKGYLYLKAKREIESCLWAKSAIRDTANVEFRRLPETVNTKNSEFGHGIFNQQLLFSSLRADSISANEEVYEKHYTTNLYLSDKDGKEFKKSEKLKDLFNEKFNSGNGTFSLDGNRFYFSKCADDGYNYKCQIMVARFSNGSWSGIDSLSEIVNEPGSNTTMPHIADIDGKETLFFASDRQETEGGLDIWYTLITNGNQFGKVKPVKVFNSPDNDITPWYNPIEKRLYFSSSWLDGFGGHDIFYSNYTSAFEDPVNLGLPFNSSANDIYYFQHKDTSYITSNRIGVLYSKNPTCCSDIFSMNKPVIIIPPTPKETLEDLNKRLPVTLYFHNDVPDPRSTDSITKLNYITSYDDYTAMLETYKKEYSSGVKGEKGEEAKEDIESFFLEYVDQGVKDLVLFRDLLLEELDKGTRIKITIQGFASPLAKTDYNVNLTKRRISSLRNYLREYNNGIFVPYLNGTAKNGGLVVFQQVPFGEYSANQLTSDNPNDVKNSVYSRAAAIERKIEIQSVSYLEKQEEFPLSTNSTIYNAGMKKSGDLIRAQFKLINTTKEIVELEIFDSLDVSLKVSTSLISIAPNEEVTIGVEYNSINEKGHIMKTIPLVVKGVNEKLSLIITTELQ